MKSRKIIFLILLLYFSTNAYGQKVSQNKMVDDFNQLIAIINNYYSALPLVEQRTQTSISEQFKLLKKECYTLKTREEFGHLVNMTLNVLNDKHATVVNAGIVKMYLTQFSELANLGNISLSDTLNADYFFKLKNNIMPKMKTGIRSKYIDGHYYNARAFSYQGISFDLGDEIIEINGIPISEYVDQNKYELYNLTWDEKNKKWYSELFWLNKNIIDNDKFDLTICNKDITLNCNKKVNLTQEIKQFSASPLVTNFDNILYIRMPIMFNGDWFSDQIVSNYNPDINRIIIDIRGNRGGQDRAWKEVLSTIIKQPIPLKSEIAINDNEAVKNALHLYNLNSSQLIITDTIYPLDNSINFNDKIYILQDRDTYSAASSFTSIAFQSENIISVGYPISHIGGRGLTPLIFKLNNSGIVFRIPFTIDLSGGTANPYMNKVEIELQQSIQDYLCMINTNQYDIEFVKNKDLMIKYIRKQ